MCYVLFQHGEQYANEALKVDALLTATNKLCAKGKKVAIFTRKSSQTIIEVVIKFSS